MYEVSNYPGISCIISFLGCLTLSLFHARLTFNSSVSLERNMKEARDLLRWSHLSTLAMSLVPFFNMLAYYRPEFIKYNQCWCFIYYRAMLVCYVMAMYALKLLYLQRVMDVKLPNITNIHTIGYQAYVYAVLSFLFLFLFCPLFPYLCVRNPVFLSFVFCFSRNTQHNIPSQKKTRIFACVFDCSHVFFFVLLSKKTLHFTTYLHPPFF